MNRRLLAIYLGDHLAALTGVRDRCRVSRSANGETALGAFLGELQAVLDDDRRALLAVTAAVGAKPSTFKTALARVAERAGRLKLNGQLTGYSPLSRLEEVELFSLSLEGSRLLWSSLAALEDPRLARFDLAARVERAHRLSEELANHHRAAARSALG